jgi:hypothetical protein
LIVHRAKKPLEGPLPKTALSGIAALFDDSERKELFRKYLFFLGWVEVLILAICYLSRLGNGGYDSYGPVELSFPWKSYFLISFLAPVAITFLIGIVIVGFNKYFGEPDPPGRISADDTNPEAEAEGSERIHSLQQWVKWLQRLPFLGLLLLLVAVVLFFYKMDVFLAFVANVGEKSVRIVLMSAAVLLGIASLFALLLVILNYQLRKKSMAYQYRSEVAERFGLIILDDNTVLNNEGRLLIRGKQWKDSVPLLPAEANEDRNTEAQADPLPRPLDLKTSS